MQGNKKTMNNDIGQIIKLQVIFLMMSILLLILVAIFRDNVNGYIWLRSVELTILSLVFIRFGFKLNERKRSTYVRMIIFSIAGAFGIYALAIGGGDVYPLWMRIEQGLQGLLLIMITIIITRPKNRIYFAKEQK